MITHFKDKKIESEITNTTNLYDTSTHSLTSFPSGVNRLSVDTWAIGSHNINTHIENA